MKKNIFSLGVLAAAAIALVGCAKTETNVPEVKGTGIPFEFTATSAVTKTTNDTEATDWVAGDQVNLFHELLGGTTSTYVSDGAFTAATDGAEVKFTGTLAEDFDPEGTYNWYALYPYTSQVTTPANYEAGYVYLGCRSDRTQTQKGNDSMDHIAGNNYPIAGIAEKISGSEKLSIAMTHLTSLIEVRVTNGTSDPITVTDIAFTGTEDIVGSYFVDFASSPIVFTPSKSDFVANTAKLTVEDGTPIAAGKDASFYLAVKPFTAHAGEKLTLSVTTDEHGAQEVEKTLTADAAFEAGVENFLNFNYTKEDALPVLSLPFEDSMSWATADEDGPELTEEAFPTTKEGVVLYSSMTKCYTGAEGLKFGSSSARGEITTSNIDLSSPYTIIISAKQWGTDESTLQVLVDDVEVSANEVLYNEFLEYVYKPTVGTASSKVTIKVNGKRGYVNNIRIISGTSYTAKPLIHITSVPSEFAAEGGNGEIGYEILNPGSGSVAAEAGASWVSSLDYSEDNVISFAVAANTGEFRTQNVTLSYPGADDVLVPVQQSAYVAPGSEKEYTFTISPADFNNTSYAANNGEHTSTATATDGSEIEITWYSNQVMLGSKGDMQWQKNNGYIYNVTSLGSVEDVSITSSAGSFTTSINSSANPTTDAGEGAFFKVAVGNATGYTQSIVVTFKK